MRGHAVAVANRLRWLYHGGREYPDRNAVAERWQDWCDGWLRSCSGSPPGVGCAKPPPSPTRSTITPVSRPEAAVERFFSRFRRLGVCGSTIRRLQGAHCFISRAALVRSFGEMHSARVSIYPAVFARSAAFFAWLVLSSRSRLCSPSSRLAVSGRARFRKSPGPI